MPLEAGDLAPDFTLKDENSENFTLSNQRTGKIMLVFIRGGWWPHWRNQVKRLNGDPEITERVKIVMVSPESVSKNKELKEKFHATNITFLSDHETNLQVIKEYGVYDTKSQTARLLHGIKETSKPATFILDKDRKISYKFIGKNYRTRPRNRELVKFLTS